MILHTTQLESQQQFWHSPARWRLFAGGVGSGKTRAGALETLRMPPDSMGVVLAPTYPMLRDATLRTFLELAHAAEILEGFNKGEMAAQVAGNRTILFRSADKPDRLRGPNLGWFWLDEAAMMPHSVWLIMIGRLRERPGRAWCTTTPRGKDWLHRTFVEVDDPEYHVVRASTRSNTFLPSAFVKSLDAAYDPSFAAQEIEGEFLDETLGLLIPADHVDRLPTLVRPKKGGGPRWLSCDLGEGGGRDSTVILVGDHLGILHGIESPWIGPVGAAAHIAELARVWDVRHDRIVYDAGGGRGTSIVAYLEQHGITEAYGYKGSRAGGRRFENLRARMGFSLRDRLDPDRPRPLPPMSYPADWKPSIFDPPPEPTKYEPQPPFCLPPGDKPWWPLLEVELKALKWYHKGKQIALEPKDKFSARLGRSPNVLDALMMSRVLDDEEMN